MRALAGEAVEDAPGGFEMLEAFFFGAKLRRMRDKAAAGAARRMLDVQHFVEEDILHDEGRDARMVHPAVQ